MCKGDLLWTFWIDTLLLVLIQLTQASTLTLELWFQFPYCPPWFIYRILVLQSHSLQSQMHCDYIYHTFIVILSRINIIIIIINSTLYSLGIYFHLCSIAAYDHAHEKKREGKEKSPVLCYNSLWPCKSILNRCAMHQNCQISKNWSPMRSYCY